MLRYLTAGESHGPALVGIIDGMPANVLVNQQDLDLELKRRQAGHGRGGRMSIEQDTARILSGVRFGKTLGSPIGLIIENRDWPNWTTQMSQFEDIWVEPLTKPRPGHADLVGMLKFGHKDARNILERASARETATRVACGYFAKALLSLLDVFVLSHVVQIGQVKAPGMNITSTDRNKIDDSGVRCIDPASSQAMMDEIDRAKSNSETLGGIFEVLVFGLVPGLGNFTHWDMKLDARIAMAIKSIQAIKGIEFGGGFDLAAMPGSMTHDQIYYDDNRGFFRKTNNCGGFEGGMSNGETLVIRAAMKPIATIPKPLATIDTDTLEPAEAIVERSDTCAVPAAAVVAESCTAIEVAGAILEMFGTGDMNRIHERYMLYKNSIVLPNG